MFDMRGVQGPALYAVGLPRLPQMRLVHEPVQPIARWRALGRALGPSLTPAVLSHSEQLVVFISRLSCPPVDPLTWQPPDVYVGGRKPDHSQQRIGQPPQSVIRQGQRDARHDANLQESLPFSFVLLEVAKEDIANRKNAHDNGQVEP
jgi:hypothetical protein